MKKIIFIYFLLYFCLFYKTAQASTLSSTNWLKRTEAALLKILPYPTPASPLIKLKDEFPRDDRPWKKSRYYTHIAKVSQRYGIDPQLIYATIMTESDGNQYAYRYEPHLNEASLCLGQILISTARSLGFRDEPEKMYHPDICIDLIAKYYRRTLNAYGKLTPQQLARAYNAGSPWKSSVRGHLVRFNKWYYETS